MPDTRSSTKWKYLVLVALVVSALASAFVIYFSPTPFGSSTGTLTTSKSPTGSSTTYRPPSDYVCVRAVSDCDGTPIEGIEFHCSPATVQNGTTTVTTILLTAKTDSSGWACVQWLYPTHSDIMILKTEYQGKAYSLAVPMFLGENYALISLPSGNVTTTSCTREGVEIGQTSLKDMGSGLNSSAIFVNVKNVGKSPVYIKMAYVNCIPIHFNGTDLYLEASSNPIMPEQEATIAAFYKHGTNIRAPATIYFVIVTGDGLEIIDVINVYGGTTTTPEASTLSD